MEFLQKYLAQIKAQLTGLTLSQRLLIGLLILVMIATIFFTVMLSAKPEMVVLIPQAMTQDEINRAEMAMKGKYTYQISGDRILVPTEKAYQIRGELFAAQALPKDTSQAFIELMKESDFMHTDASNERRWNYARQETLAKILRGFPYIADANVIISKGERSGLGRDAVPSSAMVTVKVHGNEALTGAQVVAIADMVRGAVAGMKREDVHITDGMRPYHAPSSDTQMPTDILAWKKSFEEDLTKKLYVVLASYGDVKIAVNVIPNMSKVTTKELKHGAKPVKAEIRTTSHETKSEDASPAGSPGVMSNTTGVVAGASSKGGSSSTTENTSENVVRIDQTETESFTQPGSEYKRMTASISLPRSFFVSLYRRAKNDQKTDPNDEDGEFKKLIASTLTRVQGIAEKAIGAETEQVKVDWFDDTILARGDGGEGGKQMVVSGTFGSIAQYAKQGVLGLVALAALMMMLMMVRRAVPATAGAEVDPSVFFGGSGSGGKGKKKGDPTQLDAGEDVFGEAGSGEAVLTGIELDDETLQSRKMVDEVSTMIKENPENAATLVKKWISKGK